MKYRMIMLPSWLMETWYWLSLIILIPTAILETLFMPFQYMKWRFHLTALALCGALWCYLLIIGRANAFLLAVQVFIAVVVAVAVMELLAWLIHKFCFCLAHFRRRYPIVKTWFVLPAFMCPKSWLLTDA